MQRTNFAEISCSIARTFDLLGEPWTALILRDVFTGVTRFEGLQRDLGVSRKVLAERLGRLVDQQVLRRRSYSDRPPRYEYLLTDKGFELCAVLLVAVAWGDRWTAGSAGPPALLYHRTCGALTRAEVRCAECGEPLHATDVDIEDGRGPTR
ncbi:transcriptional regulator, HxlR family [Micromonospora echinaurantiaca]|uniref:Transcriptional regulator, HxlR family n=1 Tax=Micromonospora echinaurantiaca TaxID=47857 RepID=A0A1C5IH53_9ACTN|nr:helix-turn-helix domain-containing protein [Micromonospora echinaurantiaca]SCG57379.1 transcriptional regulator, HxlR family [Micromonospora echinaurantiaca]